METEFDKFAEDYDTLCDFYKEDIKFYKNQALKINGKVLEVGCGTGRIYLELLKKEVDIYGIDISKEMLRKLKEKAKKLKLKPKVYQRDMKNFKINKKFSLIIVPFRTFLFNLTIKDQIKTLKNFKKHLSKKGKLIINFFYPETEILSKTKYKTKKTRKGTFFIDKPNQIIEMINKTKKGYRSYRMALIYKREFELLLKLAGFKKWKVYGGFNKERLRSYNQEMVWIIEN